MNWRKSPSRQNKLSLLAGSFIGLLCRKVVPVLAFGVFVLALAACIAEQKTITPAALTPTADNSDRFITVHYNERPPYLITTQTGVTGLTGDPVTVAFEQGGVPFRWQQTPTKRQIYLLEQNIGQDCVVAWFKNPEREAFAKFSLPIYQDQPQIALARADNKKAPDRGAIESFFLNRDLVLLVKDGYSYGEFLDQKIAQYQPHRLPTTNENEGMLKMIYAGHADYMLVAPEEADGLIKTSPYDERDFKRISFTDILSGEKRYILCSKQVDDATMQMLDDAIQRYIHISDD